eukprot:9284190-Pyramimonas_sp.AAC.1
MFVGMSWETSRGPLGGSSEARSSVWGHLGAYCWASWAPRGASWRPLVRYFIKTPHTRWSVRGGPSTTR